MIFLAFSKKGKSFATFYREICAKIICTIKIYFKMHFPHKLQCSLQHVINLLIFINFENFKENLSYLFNPLKPHLDFSN